MEIGPFRTKEDKLVPNPGSWNKDANLLFVDQPVGVGLSTIDTDSYIHELPEMAANITAFFKKYFEIFPDQLSYDFYIAGESYAGQYIPYIADAVLKHNKKATDGEINIPLKGIMIGNGWIDPKNQYPAYLPFAYEKGLIKPGSSAASVLENRQRECLQSLANEGTDNQPVHNTVCEQIFTTMLREMYLETGLPKTDPNACVNMYDIRLHDTYSSCGMNWPPDLTTVTPYLHRTDVLQALNIDAEDRNSWRECNRGVGSAFKAKHSNASVTLIPGILEQGIPVLMFNGDQDFICNSEGNERLIKALTWGGEKSPSSGFLEDEVAQDWYVNGTASGIYQSGRNLTYIKVYNASHMVAFDVPEVAQTMLNQFIGIPGYDLEKPQDQSKVHSEEVEDNANNEGDDSNNGEGGETKWHSHPLSVGAIIFLFFLVLLFFYTCIKRNRSLVAEANASNVRRTSAYRDAEEEEEARPTGILGTISQRFSTWRRGGSGFAKLDTDEDESASVPLNTLNAGGSRVSLDSNDSILSDSELRAERSDQIV